MARLNTFKIDAAAVESGAWVSPGEEYDDLKIRTRGFTDAYYDAQNRKLRRAALSLNGDTAKIPNAVSKEIRIECLINHVLLDVSGLVDDAGATIDFAKFCDLLRDPNYSQLVVAAMAAAGMVGRQGELDKGDAAGNSGTPSA